MNEYQYPQQGLTQYGEAPNTNSPISGTSADVTRTDANARSEILRVLSRLEILERDLSRAKHRIQQLETAIGLIEQRVNSRLN
jgi:CII-binding regulator of phage lambda lysogenization HflD